MAIIPSKYGGWCKACGSIVKLGDHVTYGQTGWRHVDCPGLRPMIEKEDPTPRCRNSKCRTANPTVPRCRKCGEFVTEP